MIKEALLGLGLTKNEVTIYITLLDKGDLSVNEIGSKAGLHRQVCYDALDRLVEKGFVSFVYMNSKKFFRALNPQKILDYLDEQKAKVDRKKETVTAILPELEKIFRLQKKETNVEVIKGSNVLRTIYNDIFQTVRKSKEPLLAMGIEETKFLEFDKIAIKQHIARLRREKLKEKLLSREGATFFFEGNTSEYRFLPDNLFNPNPTHIYGDNVAIIVWGRPVYGIIIRSKEIADANRKYFKVLWKTAKKKN